MTKAISLTNCELKRLDIINRLIRRQINGSQASELTGLTVRQIRRLKAKIIKEGQRGIAHGNRGKMSNFKISSDERELIVSLIKENYDDFGPTLVAEKLFERHNIKHDIKTIRNIMIVEKIWIPRNRKKSSVNVHRAWRLRRANYGELVQFDGSYEHWFEDRNNTAEICLLAAVDDATGKIVYAKFDIHEGIFPVFAFWQDYLINNGKPLSIYLDKFSTYKMNQKVALENHDIKTQFQRALSELQIEPIFANSPQAKGRVERLFNTLQDRLIKELRLDGISDIKTANKFLKKKFIPDFNRKFSVTPRNTTNLHKPLTEKEKTKLSGILSKQTVRIVQNDFTISFKNQWYQLLPNQPVTICKRDKILIEEHTNKTIIFKMRDKQLNIKAIPKRQEHIKPNKQPWIIPAGQKN